MTEPQISEPLVHRMAPTWPHEFVPSGRYVGKTRVEACERCGLAQRGPGSIHPEAS